MIARPFAASHAVEMHRRLASHFILPLFPAYVCPACGDQIISCRSSAFGGLYEGAIVTGNHQSEEEVHFELQVSLLGRVPL
jgi:hypothetical protein